MGPLTRRLRAHAKINLYLRVLGRRSDGFHEIETVVQSITLHDALELELGGEGIRLEVSDPSLPNGPSNLAWRAAAALLPDPGPGGGVRLRLTKRIPVGAGLGGGSSDAAAALVGVNSLCGLGLAGGELQRLAADLGSDVPYFLSGGTALLTGRGTEVRALPDLPRADLLVVPAAEPLSTADVYAQIQEPLTLASRTASISGSGRIPADFESLVRLGNDLEPPAVRLRPAIGRVREALLAAGARVAAMTGSGSAVFGVFSGVTAAREAATKLERTGLRPSVCATLDRATFQRDLMES